MKASTIKRNTPTMPTKVAFYNALVSFFETTIGNPNVTLTEEQQRCVDAINKFEDGDTHIHFPYSLRTLDLQVVRSLTPMHRRKRNLYRILTAFFDTSLSNVVDKIGSDEEDTDGYKDTVIAANACLLAIPVEVALHTPCDIATHQAKKVKESRLKKNYSVKVTKEFSYLTSVSATNQEEAERIALEEAESTSIDEWRDGYTDIIVYGGEV